MAEFTFDDFDRLAVPASDYFEELFYETTSVSVHSKGSTVSGLPGPGMTLDHILGILGRRFVVWLAKEAHNIGLGPVATHKKLQRHLNASQNGLMCPKTKKYCSKLLQYTSAYVHALLT